MIRYKKVLAATIVASVIALGGPILWGATDKYLALCWIISVFAVHISSAMCGFVEGWHCGWQDRSNLSKQKQ